MGPFASARTRHRHREPEWMDQPGLDAQEHARALAGLGRINRLSRSAAILWLRIARLAREQSSSPLRVLDVACGGGDIPVSLARRASRAGLVVRVDGCDVSDEAVRFAQSIAARYGVDVGFFLLNALHDPIPERYDVITCSLFLHHLDQDDAILLLQRMAAATRRIVLVNDLERTRRGYWLAWVGCRLLTRSPIVWNDGPISVAAAFTGPEARTLAERAGLHGAAVTRHWPERFLLSWSRS
jgi:2-polyprenyl-3-methyl-5-hydroxy-6-metoxy-1,4-benzoquinol methylase